MRALKFREAFKKFTYVYMDRKLESGSCPCVVGDEMKLAKLNIPAKLKILK